MARPAFSGTNGGCLFAADPQKAFDRQPIFWAPEALPSVLSLRANSPSRDIGHYDLDLTMLPGGEFRRAPEWMARDRTTASARLPENKLAGKAMDRALVVVRSRAIHLVHDEIRRQAAWSDQDRNVRCPWTGYLDTTDGWQSLRRPENRVVDRTPFGGQLRKDNPILCRKTLVAPFNRAGMARAP